MADADRPGGGVARTPDGEGSILDQAIAKISNEALRGRIAREVELLRGSRRFGLVFDRHLPESVRLPAHPVRKGVQVALRDESSDVTWRVAGFTDKTRATAVLDDGNKIGTERLVVVREFGEPVSPGLRTAERIANGQPHESWHIVINGENYHVLQALRTTHRGKVDLIYIDPPYGTGSDAWIYNDRYVDANDRSRSSKWLSFLERRLDIAKIVLKPTGVIIVAIGDDEHHRLRMIMDQVFGVDNFISDVVWQGGRKNDSRYVSNGADYMLIYARDEPALSADGVRWREEKAGVHEVLAQGAKVWAGAGGDERVATAAMRAWFKAQPKDSPVQALSRNIWFLPDGTLCRDADTQSPNRRPNLQYDLLHPVTGKPCRMHPNGWAYSRETMNRMIAEGRIIFRESENDVVSFKRPLEDTIGNVVQSVFERLRTHAGRHLETVLAGKRFPFPKDHEVLMRWIRLTAPRDAVVLDFFGGSGTTTEAVMRLNEEDGGTRQSILVTNNEVGPKQAKALRRAGHHPGDPEWEARGVFQYVTRPRIGTIVTGMRPDGSHFAAPLAANVEMFDLHYLDPGMVRRGKEFAAIAPLLWLEAGATGERIDTVPECGWALAGNYGVLFDIDVLKPFAVAVTRRAKQGRTPELVFVVTDSLTEFQLAVERLPAGITAVRLFEDYLTSYTVNTDGSAR
jgi:adenine-specific DNA-methyltransferase